jgi:parallel beta-helix repeat protein
MTKVGKLLMALGLALTLVGFVAVSTRPGGGEVRVDPANQPQAAPGDCVVTNTKNNGAGSLRGCIIGLQPNATITFSPTVFPPANPQVIFPGSDVADPPLAPLPAIVTSNVTIDASNAGVIIDGGFRPASDHGLVIDGASGVVIKGLHIRNFNDGIHLENGAANITLGGPNGLSANACTGDCNLLTNNSGGIALEGGGTTNNTIINNYVGTNSNGTVRAANSSYGVGLIGGAQFNVISGNLISGNQGPGVMIEGVGTFSNTVSHNRLGTDRTGMAEISNDNGVLISSGAQFNHVENNLIGGSLNEGIGVLDSGTQHNMISNNDIGTNLNGTGPIRNQFGVHIGNGAQDNMVVDNLISGNRQDGVMIEGASTLSNTIMSNMIGADGNGQAALQNNRAGVSIRGQAESNLILDNLISGNAFCGLVIHDSMHNTVSSNMIGTNAAGTAAIANGFGVELAQNAQSNVISDNLISGNAKPGVLVEGFGTVSNTIMSNNIGTAGNGVAALSNESFGVVMANGTQDNVVEANRIGFNERSGVGIFGENTQRNALRQNSIFNNVDKGIALLNGGNLGVEAPALNSQGFNTVSGLAAPGNTVDIYSDTGFQGQNFEGSAVADANGLFTFTQPGGFASPNLTAITTDPQGNTSEFSGNGGGVFQSLQLDAASLQATAATNSRATALADLNLDGRIDAFVVNDTTLEIWFNDGAGNFNLAQTLNSANGQAVALGDLNQDGAPDALVAYTGPNRVWLNNGSGAFGAGQTLSGSLDSQAVAVGDLDGNGSLDAIIGNAGSQANQVWLNNGSATFNLGSTVGNSEGQAVALGDFNGDQELDVVLGNGSNQANQVWLNTGSGTFTAGSNLGTNDTQAVAIGDLDRDGSLDVFIANDGLNQVWLNTGSGSFSLGPPLSGSFDSQAVALGDLNSDGFLDAFIGNGTNQGLQVWLNNSGSGFSLNQELGGSDSQAVALGDLDNDNDLDIFVANGSSQFNQLLFNQNKVILRSGPGGGTLTAVTLDGLTTTLQIPPGALTQNTTLIYEPLDTPVQPLSPTLRFAGRAFTLVAEQAGGPVSNPFVSSIQVRIDYDPAQPNPTELLLYYWDSMLTEWVDAATTCQPTSPYMRGLYFVQVAICHLTDFGLFGPAGSDVYLPLILREK